MKFGKEFSAQMIPEWVQAYMNYNELKKILKDILIFKVSRNVSSLSGPLLHRKMSLYRTFSGLTHRCRHLSNPISPHEGNEEHVILINSNPDHFETKFLLPSEEGGEYELVFFKRLDDEFNKVNKFYKDKLEEIMAEAESLNKQMDALIAFRIKVHNPQEKFLHTGLPTYETTDQSNVNHKAEGHAETPHMESIPEAEMTQDTKQRNYCNSNSIKTTTTKDDVKLHHRIPAPSNVLDHVKFNVIVETPRSALQKILRVQDKKQLNFNEEELKMVEKRLKQAFAVFYQKLRLLKSYSFLNVLAFSKIMKKYDKITLRSASKHYLRMVDNSLVGSSDEVARLMDRVESTFIKHFCNSHRRKGINILRPPAKRQRHRTTFSLGLMSGCAVALLVALIFVIRAQNVFDKAGSNQYMNTLFPLYSLFGFIVLHMLMYAANVFFWRRYRVNYAFMFGVQQGTELSFREVLLLSSSLAVLALAAVLANLDMEMDPTKQNYQTLTELVPLGLVLLVLSILFCPFNIIYRSSRFFLLACALHCVCAPLYKVTLPDFFLADQLTSQVPAIRSFEFYICYYGWGDFSHRRESCSKNAVFNTFYFIVAVIPFMMRLLQCARRYFEEKDKLQGYNSLKFLTIIAAVVLRTAYGLKKDNLGWRIMAILSSGIATIASTYWDLVIDWGLLQPQSQNRWLRDKLMVPHKKAYFIAIFLNCLLRCAWLQSVLNFRPSFLHGRALSTIFACLEIIRRGIWNFLDGICKPLKAAAFLLSSRLENEHLNNVGRYRAFKSVPLPFNYDEDEEEDGDS